MPLIEIHGGEPKYMVGSPYVVGRPHTWWPGQPADQLWGARGGPAGYQVSGIGFCERETVKQIVVQPE